MEASCKSGRESERPAICKVACRSWRQRAAIARRPAHYSGKILEMGMGMSGKTRSSLAKHRARARRQGFVQVEVRKEDAITVDRSIAVWLSLRQRRPAPIQMNMSSWL
jgi:hypothetical protein